MRSSRLSALSPVWRREIRPVAALALRLSFMRMSSRSLYSATSQSLSHLWRVGCVVHWRGVARAWWPARRAARAWCAVLCTPAAHRVACVHVTFFLIVRALRPQPTHSPGAQPDAETRGNSLPVFVKAKDRQANDQPDGYDALRDLRLPRVFLVEADFYALETLLDLLLSPQGRER